MKLFTDLSVIIGLRLILYATAMLFFPPKFGSYFYGARTKITLKNKIVWDAGQRLFAFSFIVIGVVLAIIGIFKIDDKMQRFPMVIILIGLWVLSKYFVHKSLVHKFSSE